MNEKESFFKRLKTWLLLLLMHFAKLLLKIIIVVAIGTALGFIIHYIKGYAVGSVITVIGFIVAFIGLSSQLGATGMRGDYNYNMAKMSSPKMLELEHNGRMMSDSLSFLIWMGTSGVLLIILGGSL